MFSSPDTTAPAQGGRYREDRRKKSPRGGGRFAVGYITESLFII